VSFRENSPESGMEPVDLSQKEEIGRDLLTERSLKPGGVRHREVENQFCSHLRGIEGEENVEGEVFKGIQGGLLKKKRNLRNRSLGEREGKGGGVVRKGVLRRGSDWGGREHPEPQEEGEENPKFQPISLPAKERTGAASCNLHAFVERRRREALTAAQKARRKKKGLEGEREKLMFQHRMLTFGVW